jgi:hypothetical protein
VSKYGPKDYRSKRPVRRGITEYLLVPADEMRTRGGKKSRRRRARAWKRA